MGKAVSCWILLLVMFHPSSALSNSVPSVAGVAACQREDGTGIVDVHFDLYDGDGDMMSVRLFLSADGGETFSIECTSTSPPPGSMFRSGEHFYIAWDALTDFPGFNGESILQVQANDGQSPDPGSYIKLPAGTFWMGSAYEDFGSHANERPRHLVTLTHDFYIKSSEVTNHEFVVLAQWAHDNGYISVSNDWIRDEIGNDYLLEVNQEGGEVFYDNGAFSYINPNHPVTGIPWKCAAAYCDWLNLEQGIQLAFNHSNWQCNDNDPYNAEGYRLPCDAEWEYACRAGTTTGFSNGPCTNLECEDPILDEIGWYCGNSGGSSHPVGSLVPNSWDIYDMHGNAAEWVYDWLYAYSSEHAVDPVGPPDGNYKTRRIGSWSTYARYSRSAFRAGTSPSSGGSSGIRPVKTSIDTFGIQ